MIKKIVVTKKYKTIPKDFTLELEKVTTITGENNSGKTNFIQVVNNKKDIKFLDENGTEVSPEIVYIAAENIRPSDSECKSSAKSTGLIKNLSNLFNNLEIKFEIKHQDKIINEIKNLIDHANTNLINFTGNDRHKLELKPNQEGLNPDTIIQVLIESITGNDCGEDRKLEDLGQGTQRIITASILKAYIDILIEKGVHVQKPILILFEEPEIYLHPKLIRTLNTTLEKIAGQENHQVLITTHNPYFAFKNLEGIEKTLVSFIKKEGTTENKKGVIYGIEDELLFTFLFSLLENKDKKLIKADVDGFEKRDYIWDTGIKKQYSDLEYIRHQIHHLGDNHYTIGLVLEKPSDSSKKNYYTEKELSDSIKKICELLGK